MEKFDLAVGLRVTGVAFPLFHTQRCQEIFVSALSSGEPGGVDAAVIGQRRGRDGIFISGGKELGDHVIASNAGDHVIAHK